LCRLDALTDPGSTAVIGEGQGGPRRLMVIRAKGRVFAYVNDCPHVGLPLDFVPGRFLSADGHHILCANHGALFRIDDGLCIAGPCRGAALEAVPCRIEGGAVVLA
jgi:nitrite reductase/ring-hydroxylating ferredoxin subunit